MEYFVKNIKSLVIAGTFALTSLVSFSSSATPIVNFFIDGNTFFNSFQIDNNSDAGEQITKISFDISGLGVAFDTVSGGAVNSSDGKQFTPVGGSDVTTGLIGPVLVGDGDTLLEMAFSDFQSAESIIWDIDVDFLPKPTRVDGDDLIGAFLSVEFDNGLILEGMLEAVTGNSDASQFVATGIRNAIPEPSVIALMVGGLFLLRRKIVK